MKRQKKAQPEGPVVYIADARHPFRKLKGVEVEIKVCEKLTYAILGDKRFVLGTSAFYDRADAVKRKLELLEKISRLPENRHNHQRIRAARMMLTDFAAGTEVT